MEIEELAARMEAGFQSVHSEVTAVRLVAEEARDQSRVTNGRVSKLETWKAYMDGVKSGADGLWHIALAAVAGASCVAAIVLAVGR